eukprot:jgi/Botrbrau1/2237/Bobra.101_2s0065.1
MALESHMADMNPPPPPPDSPPPSKVRKLNDGGPCAVGASAAAPIITGEDQVAQALTKLAGHLGNPKKFPKASSLLRQLLIDNKLDLHHANLLFQALKASMSDLERPLSPGLSKEYVKLFTAASKVNEMFSARQKSQLDVYGLYSVLRNQLQTDDSFVFNRVLGQLKTSISHLAEATPEDNSVLLRLKEQQAAEAGQPLEELPQEEAEHPKKKQKVPQEPPPGIPEGDDIFGLDSLFTQPKKKEKVDTWSSREAGAMKREALLCCLETARQCYEHAWARTSVDIAIEEAYKARERFCESQQPRIEALWRFVKEQRMRRRQGGSGRNKAGDMTAFEAAQAAWGARQGISSRGVVGAEGDTGGKEVWLG